MSTPEDIDASELQVEILKSTHNLAIFDCSLDDEMGLNEFIHEEALQYRKRKPRRYIPVFIKKEFLVLSPWQ